MSYESLIQLNKYSVLTCNINRECFYNAKLQKLCSFKHMMVCMWTPVNIPASLASASTLQLF